MSRRPLRSVAFYGAVAGTSLLSLAALNVAADKLPRVAGVAALRDFLVRRNG